jgi:hypothetical protein
MSSSSSRKSAIDATLLIGCGPPAPPKPKCETTDPPDPPSSVPLQFEITKQIRMVVERMEFVNAFATNEKKAGEGSLDPQRLVENEIVAFINKLQTLTANGSSIETSSFGILGLRVVDLLRFGGELELWSKSNLISESIKPLLSREAGKLIERATRELAAN